MHVRIYPYKERERRTECMCVRDREKEEGRELEHFHQKIIFLWVCRLLLVAEPRQWFLVHTGPLPRAERKLENPRSTQDDDCRSSTRRDWSPVVRAAWRIVPREEASTIDCFHVDAVSVLWRRATRIHSIRETRRKVKRFDFRSPWTLGTSRSASSGYVETVKISIVRLW